MINFPDLPIRECHLGHQTKSLRVIRSEKTVVPAKVCDHARYVRAQKVAPIEIQSKCVFVLSQ